MFRPLSDDQIDWNAEEPNHKIGIKRFGQAEPTNATDKIKVSSWKYEIKYWDIVSPNAIFAIATNGSILVSHDSLLTFSLYPSIPASGGNRQVWHNPQNTDLIIILGNKVNYASTNGGVSFTRQETNVDVEEYRFHPTKPNFGLAQTNGQLYLTQDLGKSWKLLASQVVQFDWCRAGTGGVPEGRICAISSLSNGVQTFRYTNDLGGSWTTPLNETTFFFRVHNQFITLHGLYKESFQYFVSSDDGASFHRVLLPRGLEAGFIYRQQLLEDSNGAIWIVIPTEKTIQNTSQSGNLYTTDAEGYEFSLVLRGVHTFNNYWDVEFITFMEGTLFANKLAGFEGKKPKLTTTITYDNGDTWLPLERPDHDINGKKYACEKRSKEECALHLFGITTWLGVGGDGSYGDFKTNEDAVGVIAGNGNVGAHLSTDHDDVNTYLSLDGGATWDEVMEGSTIYDFGDFGGLFVLAHNQVTTKKVFYSWDGGRTFSFVQLPTKVYIANIITVSTKSEVFLVLSYEQIGKTKIRRIWGLDFNNLHTRNCSDSDYEVWTPHNGVQGPKCVLGRDLVYKRRKRDSACYTDDHINKIVSNTSCPCDQERDYECDFNWGRAENSGKCLYEGQPEDYVINGCSDGQATYKISKGYRKVRGNTCTGDIESLKPTIKECPTGVDKSTPWGLIILGSTTVILVALIIGFCFGVRDERVRKMFPWLNQAPAWVTAGYSNSLVVAEMGDEFDDDEEVRLSDEGELSTSLSD